MPGVLNTSVSGLLAFQRALATTAHNVANASTPGYSRQSTELAQRPGQALPSGFIGRGVQAEDVIRVRDMFVEARLRGAITDDGRTRVYAELASRLDNLLADEQTGLGPALSSFFGALNDLSNDPSSTTARRFVIAEAESMVDRFRFIDSEIAGLASEIDTRLSTQIADINALTDDIASINQDVVTATSLGGGSTPNDLLDLRQRRINELATLVGIRVVPQDNGAMNVFTSSGQALVVDNNASPLQVLRDPSDPLTVVVADAAGGILGNQLAGGELGGLLDFRREAFATARGELGRLAIVLADQFNVSHGAGVDANGALGGDFFAVPAPSVTAHAANAGSAAISASITDSTQLTASDYELSYDGASYTLTRLEDGASVSGAGPLSMDGVQVAIGAGAAAGDSFLIKPTARGAELLDVVLGDPAALAAAVPVRSLAASTNLGDAFVSQPAVTDATDPALFNDVSIVFNDPPGTFDVVDVTAGSTLAAGVAYTAGMTVSANGWSLSIDGTPQAGDSVDVERNAGGIGDNRNALALAALQTTELVGGTMSLERGYSAFVGQVGSSARTANFNAEARALLLEDASVARESVSGVNLDEEAADLTRYQQAYQAMARVLETSNALFDELIAAVR